MITISSKEGIILGGGGGYLVIRMHMVYSTTISIVSNCEVTMAMVPFKVAVLICVVR